MLQPQGAKEGTPTQPGEWGTAISAMPLSLRLNKNYLAFRENTLISNPHHFLSAHGPLCNNPFLNFAEDRH